MKKIRGLPMPKSSKKKIVKHLKGDIDTYKEEAKEDKDLIKKLKSEKGESKKHEKKEHDKKAPKKKPAKKYSKKAENKISKVMREGYKGKLHSGSKKGPVVTNPKQMKAIALSEARQKGLKVPKRKKKK